MIAPIRLVPLLPMSSEFVSSFVHPLRSIFHTKIIVELPLNNVLNAVYDDSRLQYNSTQLIRELLKEFPSSSSKIIGITSVDLFVPVLTYVFGEAQLDGTAAVVSTYRLDNAVYGLEPDPILFFQRSLTEIVHELGHTYGLYHCKNQECAMHSSTAVEDIDLKSAMLCNDCTKQIGVSN
ncbi:MAG: archaemetzincin family Zn-dependent metalloprotease [Bacteroidota bacterium]|nr:archaemetzincin family Zn-dependent metalloprotease [Bacteroidota bacterium]